MESDGDAEEILCINCAELYPVNLLHSGCLPTDITDFVRLKEGRLTVNASITFNTSPHR
ncbi:hypothetical protein [Alteromonas sp. S015]|uniref:hypothetical protein n=1 Tax=Alteromonas sp. S015 TaxID=3117401 RepID=UPI002FE013F7